MKLTFVLIYLGNVTVFGWAIRHYFARPAGLPQGMKIVGIAGVVAAAVQTVSAVLIHAVPRWRWVGSLLLASAALFLFVWTASAAAGQRLSLAFSPDLPKHVNTKGPYRYIRHPFYAAYILNWLAPCLYSPSLITFSAAGAMFGLYVIAARFEERKFTNSALSQEYGEYAAVTGMFFPKWTRDGSPH